MKSKRSIISLLRGKLKEVNADSIYTNRFLYSSLQEQAGWIMRREWTSGKLSQNVSVTQKIPCLRTEKINKVDCPDFIKGVSIYRTVCKLPPMWETDRSPMIIRVSSLDNFTEFKIITSTSSENKAHSPYRKYFSEKYCYYEGGYLYFTENPGRASIRAIFKEDVSTLDCNGECSEGQCRKYLDKGFFVPEWLEAEIIEKTFSVLMGTKQLPNDEKIDSNTNQR